MAGILNVPGLWPVFDANGDPVSGAAIRFYEPNTTIPKTVYSTETLSVALGTSLTTNAAGEPTTLAGVVARLWWAGSGAAFDVQVNYGAFTRTWSNVFVTPAIGAGGHVPTALSPEDFGASGKGDVYDTAALLRWRDALFVTAALNGVALGTFGGRYKINANILFSGWTGNITLMQTAAGAGPVLDGGTSRWDGWTFSGGGVTGSPTTITANAVRGDISVIVANPALFAVGNYVEVGAVDANGNSLLCWNKIVGIVGNTLLLECPLPFHVISANVTRVQKTNLQSGLVVRGMSASSTVASGTKVQGLNFYNLVGADIRDISTSNINSFESTAVAFYGLYNCTIDNVSDLGSGYATGSSSAAIFIAGTDLSISRFNSQAATGFAIDMVNVNRSRVRDIDAMRAAGRAIKFVGCCSNEGSGFTASSTATFVGLGLTGGSSDNLIMGVIVNGSLTASATGLWLNGTGNVNNTFIGINSKGNAFDIAVGNLDIGNVFDNVNNDIGVVQTGTSGAIIRTARRTFVQVRPTVAQAVASGASFVKGIYGTKIADANGEFNTTTSRFTAKVPNVYSFRAQTTWNGLPTAAIVDLAFNVNTNGYVGRSSRRRDTSNNFSVNHSFSVFLTEGEYVETIIGQSSGGSLSTTADFETRLEITGS